MSPSSYGVGNHPDIPTSKLKGENDQVTYPSLTSHNTLIHFQLITRRNNLAMFLLLFPFMCSNWMPPPLKFFGFLFLLVNPSSTSHLSIKVLCHCLLNLGIDSTSLRMTFIISQFIAEVSLMMTSASFMMAPVTYYWSLRAISCLWKFSIAAKYLREPNKKEQGKTDCILIGLGMQLHNHLFHWNYNFLLVCL